MSALEERSQFVLPMRAVFEAADRFAEARAKGREQSGNGR